MQQPTELREETRSVANSTKQPSVTPEPSTESANDSSESSLRKPVTSVRKILANQLNALKSTGPKTPEGKKRSRRNALKYGLLAREIGFASSEERASDTEYVKMSAALRKHFEPANIMEDLLVQKIGTCLWGQKMVLRAISGESHKQRFLGMSESISHRSSVLPAWFQLVVKYNREEKGTYLMPAEESIIQQMRQHRVGIMMFRRYLRMIRAELEGTGTVPPELRDLLRLSCRRSDANFMLSCLSNDTPNTPEQVAKFLERLDKEDESLAVKARSLAEEAELDEARFSVPEERADVLIRWDNHYSREFYRAAGELERLQRRRAGEAVVPPIKMDFTGVV